MLPCLILGGGLGTRLGARTRDIPKPLVDVAGVPFVHHQLAWLADQGVTDVVYSTGHLGHLIRDEVGSGPEGIEVRFIDDGATRRGTAGAVRLAVDSGAVGEAFLVLYGDSYLQVEVDEVIDTFTRSAAEGVMTVHRNDGRWDRSNVVLQHGLVARYDKAEPDPTGVGMCHIDYGLSVLRSSTITRLVPDDDRAHDLAEVHAAMAAEGSLAAHVAERRFYEIGSPEGLAQLEAHLLASRP